MTRVSGTNIIKAPCCGALLATPAYSSINFMAWEYWTDDMNALFGDEAKHFLTFLVQVLRSSQVVSASRRLTSPGSTFPPP
jgi:hypothetical protein